DDFEDGNYWYAVRNSWDEWGTHNLSLTAELSNEWGTAGLTSLNCSMEAATSHTSKQACWCSDAPLITDFSPYKYLVVDCYNPESSDFNISFAIQTNKWSKWIATPTENVPNGEHTLVFCFEGIFNEEDLSNVNRIILQSLGENNGGHIYFDNIRLYK
ncbi:MAG: hypothetical protein HUK25_09815, partial [Treponema sp.]|nr:hypothetical protein [Treponema sp.]